MYELQVTYQDGMKDDTPNMVTKRYFLDYRFKNVGMNADALFSGLAFPNKIKEVASCFKMLDIPYTSEELMDKAVECFCRERKIHLVEDNHHHILPIEIDGDLNSY